MSAHAAKRWTLSIEGDTLTASTSAAVYTVTIGVTYQPRVGASSETPRVVAAFLDGGARIYSHNAIGSRSKGGGNRTMASVDSFVHTYNVPRRSLRLPAAPAAVNLPELTATAALVARVAAVEAIVRCIAVELGVALDSEAT